ncbi:hypothetical protein NPX13_g1963 [Xylaria arbuscula]|uniref:Heterokaryon incompatibility domain-containing protein n=1 Tax=Xylaria arbuscula TaxID=114810 RepID=A0A9W8TPM0_9PEZI|nr:hypothetical protein NPX13_g1963 [Xylaria arbuscula]
MNPIAPLCCKCRHRKLDLSPLVAKPPDISESCCKEVENECLDALERRFEVHIHKFSAEEAAAKKSRCSLCALLSACLEETQQDGWLGYMQCTVTLRPRFDRSTNSTKRGTIVHRQQIWVEFQPIEGEVLLDLVDDKGFRPTGKRRPICSTADLKLLRWWLKNCDRKHSHPDTSNEVLSRMQAILDDGLFRLINTSTGLVEAMASLPIFVALSYVWGSASGQPRIQPLKGGPVADYPPTIRDAIITSNSLGDSECDKAKLIPYMKDIYATADLTIVAACGTGAEDGLIGTEVTPRTPLKPLVIGPSFAVAPVSIPFEGLIKDTVWYKRGWTFQEYVFSRRLLLVLKREMFFACADHISRESMGCRPVIKNEGSIDRWVFYESGRCEAQKLQTMLHKKGPKSDQMLTESLFLDAVREYSSRKLSVGSDRFAAFAGVILSSVDPGNPMSEAAFLKHGHPLCFFESLLNWTPNRPIFDPPPADKMPTPSWSWGYTGQDVWIPTPKHAYNWYDFGQFRNHDIVGWPSEDNPLGDLIGLLPPQEPRPDSSWAKSIAPMPKLHLLTLVFDARLVRYEYLGNNTRRKRKDEYLLMPFGSTETPLDILRRERGIRTKEIDEWSLQQGCESYFQTPRPRPYETFAIITGWPGRGSLRYGVERSTELFYELIVMLLEPADEQDTYSRLGIAGLDNVFKDTYYVDLIRKGNPRWHCLKPHRGMDMLICETHPMLIDILGVPWFVYTFNYQEHHALIARMIAQPSSRWPT